MAGPLANQRHELFAQNLAKGMSAVDAYAQAGYKPDFGAASRLSRKVKNRVIELQAAVAKKVMEKTAVDAAWLLDRLAEEAEADLADLYAEDGSLKPVHEWPMIWRKGLVAGVDVEQIRQDGAVLGEVKKVKVSDRVKRLELIGKHVDVQAWRERLEHSGPNGGPIQTQSTDVLFDVDDFDEREMELYTELVERRLARVRGDE